mgnify:CR=1 FL=1
MKVIHGNPFHMNSHNSWTLTFTCIIEIVMTHETLRLTCIIIDIRSQCCLYAYNKDKMIQLTSTQMIQLTSILQFIKHGQHYGICDPLKFRVTKTSLFCAVGMFVKNTEQWTVIFYGRCCTKMTFDGECGEVGGQRRRHRNGNEERLNVD